MPIYRNRILPSVHGEIMPFRFMADSVMNSVREGVRIIAIANGPPQIRAIMLAETHEKRTGAG